MNSMIDEFEERKFNGLMRSMKLGGVHFLTGRNGSGKSRFLSYVTSIIGKEKKGQNNTRNRIICLSGTMYDKYPPVVYKSDTSNHSIVYLGNKVNNNMVSAMAPFRVLCHYMLRSKNFHGIQQSILLALERLHFEGQITLRFKERRSSRLSDPSILPSKFTLHLIDRPNDGDKIDFLVERLSYGALMLADICFFREGRPYWLGDLSSGERQYILAILGLAFCGSDNCFVFYDEPENSLHPEWQLSIVRDLAAVSELCFTQTTLVIATHSPLIASSVRNRNVFICDLPSGQEWSRADIFGRNSDTVLREQFHLYSARSPEVVETINHCLSMIAANETEGREFRVMQSKLANMGLKFTPDDPLTAIVATILRLR